MTHHGTGRRSFDKRAAKEIEEETVYEEVELLQGETGITHCILKNCLDMLVNSLNDEANNELTATLVDRRNADGRSPLELCAILGRDDIVKVLIKAGANVNLANCGGYTSSHYAASWGQTEVLKLLIEANADLNMTNSSSETPRVMALRYGQMECVDFIDWIAAKTSLEAAIKKMQDWVIEKRPSKEEKSLILNACKEKLAWLESVIMPTTQDFIVQQDILECSHTAIFGRNISHYQSEKNFKN